MPDDESRRIAAWLHDVIQTLAVNHPLVLQTMETRVREILDDHHRELIAERLKRLDTKGLDELTAVLTIIERTHGDEPVSTS